MKPKTLAIINYLTFIGMGIAYFLNKDQKNSFVTFHIKNMFGLVLLQIGSQFLQSYSLLQFYGETVWAVLFFLWAYSLIMAISEKKKGVPLLDTYFQNWFSFLN
ncbi:MAG: hypothetical protein ACWA45_02185 [Flavobacteriales bacterium]